MDIYIHLNAELQRIARRDKKAILSEQCKEREEDNRMGKTRDLFKKIRDTKGTFHVSSVQFSCSAIYKASSDNHFAFLHFFFLGMVLITASCRLLKTSVHSSWHYTGDRNQDHPQEKERQKGKMVVWGSLINSWEKKRSKWQRRKGKIYPFYCFSLFLCIDHSGRLSYLSLLFFGILHLNGQIFPFPPLPLASLLFSAICKAPSDIHLPFCVSFP